MKPLSHFTRRCIPDPVKHFQRLFRGTIPGEARRALFSLFS
jgi:hypothetical protein